MNPKSFDITAPGAEPNRAQAGPGVCVGFPAWKRPHVRPFISSVSTQMRFFENPERAVRYAAARNGRIIVWASGEAKGLADLAKAEGVGVVRIEDGFLRSAGLGSDFHLPYSLVLDKKGIYFDPSAPSELECILEKGGFDDGLLARARRLEDEIIRRGLTKYNLGTGVKDLVFPPDRRIVLVPGQVENDASVLRGSPEISTNIALLEAVRANRPDAFILYKPHPDILAGNRPGGISEDQALKFCDEIVGNISVGSLIPFVDEIHTMSSLTGFEALLRGKEVHTYGGPFYAGWGLTTDRMKFPRRTRRVSIDELVAAALIVYPSYYDWHSGVFCGPEAILNHLSAQSSRQHGSRSPLRRPMRFLLSVINPYLLMRSKRQ